jgi:hypothetical protein
MPLDELLQRWRPGHEEHPWEWEAITQIREDGLRVDALIVSVRNDGLRPPLPDEEPIYLGDDGRVWAGHHRIVAALLCREWRVPVVVAERVTAPARTSVSEYDVGGPS